MPIKKLPLYAELEMLRRNDTGEIQNYITDNELDSFAHDVMIEIGNIEAIYFFLGKYMLQTGPAFSNILELNQEKQVIDRILIKAVRERNSHCVPNAVRAYMQKEMKSIHDTFFNESADYEKMERLINSIPKSTVPRDEYEYLFPPYNSREQERLSREYENR